MWKAQVKCSLLRVLSIVTKETISCVTKVHLLIRSNQNTRPKKAITLALLRKKPRSLSPILRPINLWLLIMYQNNKLGWLTLLGSHLVWTTEKGCHKNIELIKSQWMRSTYWIRRLRNKVNPTSRRHPKFKSSLRRCNDGSMLNTSTHRWTVLTLHL